MDSDRGSHSQGVAQAIGHASCVVTCRIRAEVHAKKPIDLPNARFDSQRRD
jgi:hypothetical protein